MSTVIPDAKPGSDRDGGREEIGCGKWFPIAKRLGHRCCGCGLRHVFRFRVRKGGKVEMLVEG